MSLRNLLIKTLPLIIIAGFVALGLQQITADRELKLENKIELRSREAQLIELNNKYEDVLKQKTDTQKERDEQAEQIKELEQERERLERELQAKKQREAQEAERIAEASRRATATRTASAEAPVASGGSCKAEIAKYDWPQSIATNVARAESGLRPDARGDAHLTYYQNGTRYGDSWGCFQIRYLPGRPSPNQLVNAEFNVQYAYNMYKSQSWSPWSVCRNGAARCY